MFYNIKTREIKKYFKSKHLEKRYSPKMIVYIPILSCKLACTTKKENVKG